MTLEINEVDADKELARAPPENPQGPGSPSTREVYFYFFVNRGSGGRVANLLLDLEIEELKLKNILDHKTLPNVSSVKVKICALNDTDIKRARMEEVRILSNGAKSSRR